MRSSSRRRTRYWRETLSRSAACCVVGFLADRHDGDRVAARHHFGNALEHVEDRLGQRDGLAVRPDELAARETSASPDDSCPRERGRGRRPAQSAHAVRPPASSGESHPRGDASSWSWCHPGTTIETNRPKRNQGRPKPNQAHRAAMPGTQAFRFRAGRVTPHVTFHGRIRNADAFHVNEVPTSLLLCGDSMMFDAASLAARNPVLFHTTTRICTAWVSTRTCRLTCAHQFMHRAGWALTDPRRRSRRRVLEALHLDAGPVTLMDARAERRSIPAGNRRCANLGCAIVRTGRTIRAASAGRLVSEVRACEACSAASA